MSLFVDLAAAVDALVDMDPQALRDGDTVVELHRQLARVEAVTTRAIGAFDVGREWDVDGARGAPDWLAKRCRVPITKARRRTRLGRELRHMPATEQAWLAGDICDS